MQMGFYFNQDLCINCRTCVVACKDWHDIPAGPVSFMRVATVEKGKYPDVSVHSMVVTCYHCANPGCVSACPVGAISKRDEDGVVIVDNSVCLGKDSCKLCLGACPYRAPQFAAGDDARMVKCDLCLDRLIEKKKPICVEACIMRALDVGPMEALRARYGGVSAAEGFVYRDDLAPSILCNPKRDAKGLAAYKTVVSPPMPRT
ncbi:MAG: 4Fe-4S dicluster domain-containing protein [Terriglobales bacterium]